MNSRHRHTGSQSGGRPRFFFLLFLVVTVSMIFFVVNITAFQFELQQDWLVPAESSYSQIHQTAELHRFVSKAKEQMSLNDRKGLPRPLGKEIHYKVTKFQLSAGTSTSFQFSLQLLNDGANNSTEKVRTELSYSNYTSEDRIICRPRHPYIMIFQHFSQVAFPCWSILRRFPNSQRMMEIAESGRFRQRWITDMLEVFQSSGISINSKATNMDDAKNEWVATPNKTAESGWQHVISDEDPLEVEIVGPTYFIDQQDVIALQQHLLGEDYISNKAGSKLPLRVLLVTREGESRNWMYAQEVATEIERIWGDWIEVKLLPKITGSLKEQAVQFHRADIVSKFFVCSSKCFAMTQTLLIYQSILLTFHLHLV